MKFSKLILTALLGSFFLFSCTDDDNGGNPLGDYDNGVLILNQGGFGNGNASVSYLSEDMNTFQNNILTMSQARAFVVGLKMVNDKNGENRQLITDAIFENWRQQSADAMQMVRMMQ